MILTETRDLRLLVAIAAAGTLQAAARRLHVSPSALSQQLRGLEQRLGGQLFERRAQRLAATSAGLRLTAGAHDVLAELERLEREAQTLLSGASSTIRVAMSCHQSYRWLPRVLARFAQVEPQAEVMLVAEAAESPFEWLLDRRLDVALVTGKLPRDQRLQCKRLFRDELVALVSRSHPWAARRWVEAREFAAESLFADARALSPDEPLGAALLEAGNVTPRKLTQVPMTGSVALDLVEARLGVTLLPRWTLAEHSRRGLALIRVSKRGLWLDWHLATRHEPASSALSSFITVVRAVRPSPTGAPRKRPRQG